MGILTLGVMGGFLVLLFSGMWIAIVATIIGLVLLFLEQGWSNMLQATGWIVWSASDVFALASVPLFIFMGLILTESRLSERIYSSLAPLLNRLPGGLLYTNIAAGALFAACSGSSMAAAATIGSVAIPEMEKRGYPFPISIGSVGAGAILAPIIPPSILMIFYASVTEQSIGKLFIGGLIPGLILVGLFALWITLRFRFFPAWKEIRGEILPWGQAILATRGIWLIVILIVMVLGSMFAGIATASEAAAVGAFGALMLALLHRRLSWGILRKATITAVIITCQVQFIYVGVQIFSAAVARAGLVAYITGILVDLPIPPLAVLLLIYGIFLILGMLIESIPMLLMVVPVVFPTIAVLGYDPIWFGIVVTLLCVVGNVTPPVGVSLFVLQALNPDKPVMEIYKGLFPFIMVTLVGLGIITAFPELTLFLPSLMLGG